MAHTNRQMDRRLVGNVVQVVAEPRRRKVIIVHAKGLAGSQALSAARLQSKGQRQRARGRGCLLAAGRPRSQWCTGGCVCVGVVERHECSRLSISESESQLCQ